MNCHIRHVMRQKIDVFPDAIFSIIFGAFFAIESGYRVATHMEKIPKCQTNMPPNSWAESTIKRPLIITVYTDYLFKIAFR